MARQQVRRVVSSPARRCLDTVRPFGLQTGLEVETEPGLAADAPEEAFLDVLGSPANHDAVLCAHGEALERLIRAVRAKGAPVLADHDDDDWLLLKGSIWELEITGNRIRCLRHRVPLRVAECPRHG